MHRHHRARLVVLVLFLALAACSRPEGHSWNVLLLTLDTTRADFLGCYGKDGARTPHLDGLAAEGFLFEHAYSSNPVTQASHSTILTGVYPMVHGVRDNTFFHLPEDRHTLAEYLGEAGWATAAAVGGFPLTREFGTAQGFDFYDDDLTAASSDFRGRLAARRFETWYDERPAGHVNDAILPWLRQSRDRPFFVWLHYWDPHEPHIAPAPYGELFAHDPYQGEIAYADESLGAILRHLESAGELDRTLIIVTADHGEGRQEHHEMTHAFLAYDTTLHVPLIVRVPGLEGGRRITERVGTVDIVPTVLDLLGLAGQDELQGRSLAALMGGDGDGETENRRAYYSESMSPRLGHGFGELRALFLGPWKYIHGPRPELFHLDDDPRELHDLAAERPEERQQMEATLRRFLDDHRSDAAADAAYEASDETRRRLAALGYLATGGESPAEVTEELRDDGEAPQDRVGDINLQGRLRRELGDGRFTQAERTARRLLASAPDNAYYRASLASALLGLERLDDAAQLVEETPEVSEVQLNAFVAVARAVFDGGDRQRAIGMMRRLTTVGSADAWAVLARMLRETGDREALEEAVQKALEIEPGHPGASLEWVDDLIASGRLELAENTLRDLLAVHPVHFGGLVASARLRRAEGRGDAALEGLEKALRLAPRACEAHREKVEVLVELERRDAAEAALETMRRRCRNSEILRRAMTALAGQDDDLAQQEEAKR